MDYLWLEEKVLSLVKQELILGTPDHQRTALCQTAVNEVRSEGNNSSRQWRDDETQQKRVTDRKSSKRSRRCELHSLLGLLPRVYWCCLLQPEARMLLWGRQLIKMSDKLVGRNSSSRGKKEDQTQQYSLCPEAKTGGEVSRGDGLSVLLTIRDIVGWEQRGEAQQGGWVNDTLDAWVCGSYTVL